MTVVDFRKVEFDKENGVWVKPKTLEDWPWEPDLGKPYEDINGKLDPAFAKTPFAQELLAKIKADEEQPSPAAQVLHEAASLIDGDRHKEHGNRHENFADIAAHWTIHLRSKLKDGASISPKDVCWLMVYLKASRDNNGTAGLDNGRDAAGYAGLATEMLDV